jgi:hypothetical protein
MTGNFNACQKANWKFFKLIKVSEKMEFNMKCDQKVQYVRHEVLMAVNSKIMLWEVAPFSFINRYSILCCPYLQGLQKKIYTLKMDATCLPKTLVPVLLL